MEESDLSGRGKRQQQTVVGELHRVEPTILQVTSRSVLCVVEERSAQISVGPHFCSRLDVTIATRGHLAMRDYRRGRRSEVRFRSDLRGSTRSLYVTD